MGRLVTLRQTDWLPISHEEEAWYARGLSATVQPSLGAMLGAIPHSCVLKGEIVSDVE